jgi:hypothetical protein
MSKGKVYGDKEGDRRRRSSAQLRDRINAWTICIKRVPDLPLETPMYALAAHLQTSAEVAKEIWRIVHGAKRDKYRSLRRPFDDPVERFCSEMKYLSEIYVHSDDPAWQFAFENLQHCFQHFGLSPKSAESTVVSWRQSLRIYFATLQVCQGGQKAP